MPSENWHQEDKQLLRFCYQLVTSSTTMELDAASQD